MFMEDYHLHSELSVDSTEKLSNYCEAAIRKGIAEIALTEHYDKELPGLMQEFSFDFIAHRENVTRCSVRYAGKLKILLGIEIGQPHYDRKMSEQVLAANPYDFVISSMHVHKTDGDYYTIDYNALDFEKIFDRYLGETIEMLDFTDFDVLGHITYPVRYAFEKMTSFDVMKHEKKLKNLFLKLIALERGIEVNTSTFKRGGGEPALDERLYSLYYSLGGRIVTLGSDAHCAENLGAGIPQAVDTLKKIGFTEIATYEKRKKTMKGI